LKLRNAYCYLGRERATFTCVYTCNCSVAFCGSNLRGYDFVRVGLPRLVCWTVFRLSEHAAAPDARDEGFLPASSFNHLA
jgi:hypothetical protein